MNRRENEFNNNLRISELIDKSIKYNKQMPKEIDFKKDIILVEKDVIYRCYACYLGNRNLTFLSKNASLDYVIDTIGSNDYLFLMSIDE